MEVIIIAIINVIAIFLSAYLAKKGKNTADIEDGKKLTEQSELGRNLATKKDIEEITQKIETVKNELSYSSLRRHEYLMEKKQHIIKVLEKSEQLTAYKETLRHLLYNTSGRELVQQLIENIQRTTAECIHETRMVNLMHEEGSINQKASAVQDVVQPFNVFMVNVATTYLIKLNSLKNIVDSSSKEAVEIKRDMKALRDEYERDLKETHDSLDNARISYQAAMKRFLEQNFD